MEHWNEIGFQVSKLNHIIRHLVDRTAFSPREGEAPVTGFQGRIIGYLQHNRDRDVFQRDIQEHFSVSRSTVTEILQTMEKNGLVTRKPVSWDARLKKLELTQKAQKMDESVMRGFREMEATLSATLTPEEKETFLRLCDKIRAGVEEFEPCRKE